MKKLTLVIALMFVAVIGLAATPNLNVTPDQPKSLNFSIETYEQETAIRLFDEQGNLIFSEYVTDQKSYSKRFDLSKLEKGFFLLKVENSLKEIVYTIEMNKLEVSIKDMNEILKPTIITEDNKVKINFLNLAKENVVIKILDSNDRTVFEEVIEKTMVIEKAFNFEKAYKNNYMVMVKVNANSYYQPIAVK
jgi:hypothetical protein